MDYEIDPLLPRIEMALDLHGISATRFGYVVAGDPALLTKMRKGRRLRKPDLRARVESAIGVLDSKGVIE